MEANPLCISTTIPLKRLSELFDSCRWYQEDELRVGVLLLSIQKSASELLAVCSLVRNDEVIAHGFILSHTSATQCTRIGHEGYII